MEREIINLTKFQIAPILYEFAMDSDEYWNEEGETQVSGIWDDFEIIDEIQEYCSLEDLYIEWEVIVKRMSDDKYFKGSYTMWDNDENDYSLTLTEVFPKEKTITVYE